MFGIPQNYWEGNNFVLGQPAASQGAPAQSSPGLLPGQFGRLFGDITPNFSVPDSIIDPGVFQDPLMNAVGNTATGLGTTTAPPRS